MEKKNEKNEILSDVVTSIFPCKFFYIFNFSLLKQIISINKNIEKKIKIVKHLDKTLEEVIKIDLVKLFSTVKNIQIQDGIIWNKRIIYFNLDEYPKENYFNRELIDILK